MRVIVVRPARDSQFVNKSLISGKWVPISRIHPSIRDMVGGYKAARKPSFEHKAFKAELEAKKAWHDKIAQHPSHGREWQNKAGVYGTTLRQGGKNTGTSTVIMNDPLIRADSTGKRDFRRKKKQIWTHENAHAEPKRSAWRMASMDHNAGVGNQEVRLRRHGGEEGRADYLSQGHYSGYKDEFQRGYLDGPLGKNKHFIRAYKGVQDKMQAAGTKVRRQPGRR